jgi:hypothetical protein
VVVVSDPQAPDRVGPIIKGHGVSPLDALRPGSRTLDQGRRSVHRDSLPYRAFLVRPGGLERACRSCTSPMRCWQTSPAPGHGRPGRRARDRSHAPGRLLPEAPGRRRVRLRRSRRGRLATRVLPAIAPVKQNRAGDAAPLLRRALDHLTMRGARTVLLACAKLPLALAAVSDPPACLDATEALARASIPWHRAHGPA